jgi:putative transposase
VIRVAEELSSKVGLRKACQVVGISRSQVYRARRASRAVFPVPREKTSPKRKLPPAERETVRDMHNSLRFQDLVPQEVCATLMDESQYLCHWRTMYRILDKHQEVREQSNQLSHTSYTRPELLATLLNELWSWDIIRFFESTKWTYFYLYVILDVFSRFVVGWMVTLQEIASLAEELIAETCRRQGIKSGQLTMHADRGQAMTSKTMAMLLADLGVTKTHSRLHVSNDSPYSEAQFKTLKYRLDYPVRFGSLPYARSWSREFFNWYNYEHHHTGIGLLTPADVHYGRVEEVLSQRLQVLQAAYEKNPERFVKEPTILQALPSAVWINAPKKLVGFIGAS